MDPHRQSVAGKLVDVVFVLVVGFLIFRSRISEWAGVGLLWAFAQSRGTVGLTGKLLGVQGPPGGGPPSDPPPSGGAGSGGGSGSGSASRGAGTGPGGIWRGRFEGLILSSAVVFAGSSVLGPVLLTLGKARAAGLLAVLAIGVACVR